MSSRLLLFAFLISSALAGALSTFAAPLPPRRGPQDGPFGMKFVLLPKATFYMGWDGPEKPGILKEIKQDFSIAVHTVTQGQWQAVMDNNPSWFSHHGGGKELVRNFSDDELKQFPVERVSWEDAQEFIKKLNENERRSGLLYRLPTEAEWEFACRGGATSEEECSSHFYFAKPTNDLGSQQANFDGTKPFGDAPMGMSLAMPSTVGSYKPNKLGLYDMHGNIWQWCAELYEKGGSNRVLRGGAWNCDGSHCRTAERGWSAPTDRDNRVGFRLVRVSSSGR